jgi:hypothetical protein
MKVLPVLFLFLLCPVAFFGQTDSTAKNTGKAVVINKSSGPSKTKGLVYNSELSFGGKLSTAGFGFFTDFTKRVNAEKDRMYYLEINFLKHPKELKKVNEYTVALPYDTPRPFVYGKQNSFIAVKTGYGNKLLIGEKAEKNGFEINFTYTLGPSFGLVKPYYLDIWVDNDDDQNLVSHKYSTETEELFLNATSIYGYSGFGKGFDEISLIPGGFGKAGLSFDWANYDDYVKSIETGIGADLYIKDVPIMIIENNKPYFVYLYLSLQFGRKW